MKKLLLFSLFTLSFSLTKAQWVTIPDANFVAWLQTNYPACMNGNLMDTTCSGIVNETFISCNNQGIANLFGLQYFNNLQTLYCTNNLLTSLPSLSGTITYLNCQGNQLASLPPLPVSLSWLYCWDNQLTSLPSLPSNLNQIYCYNNQLTSLPILPVNLTKLYCYNNQLTSLPNLPNNLSDFRCNQNQITYLPIIPNSLTQLICSDNLINSISNFSDSLYVFLINNNPISCIPPLQVYYGTPTIFDISGTNINCLPNNIQHLGAIAQIDTMLICDLFNSNGCDVYWNISGTNFLDSNLNCNYENSETIIHKTKIKLYQFGILVQQGYFGVNYSFNTDLSTYTVKLDTTDFPFLIFCPSDGDSIVNVTVIDSLLSNINFSLKCKPGFDIGVWNIYRIHRYFPNDITPVHLLAGDIAQSIYNVSCSSGINGEVKVVINGPVSFVAPVAGALTPTVNGDTLKYTIADFSLVNANTDFAFTVLTDSTAQIGDAICFDVTVTPIAGDNNVSNNTLTHCFSVSNSYDPNEKEVSPIGDLSYPFNDWLTYTIHFQNTGTAPAQHIQILDILDTDLDESTFQLLSSSADPMVQLFGNKVHFNFVNINLPDSATSPKGSKGYVSYRVKPKPNLAFNTQIENTASIYFDFNSPIVTNTTLNTIVQGNGVNQLTIDDEQLIIYPNPTLGQVTIEMLRQAQQDSYIITVTDVFGREVLRVKQNLNPDSYRDKILNLKSLSSGVYFLKILLEDGNFAVKKIVKQ